MPSAPVVERLALRLRNETRERHMSAERSGIMPAFLRGQVDRPTYVSLLRNLYEVYRELEDGLERHASSAWVAPFQYAQFYRREAIADDLHALGGDGWLQRPLLPAGKALVAAIAEASATDVSLLAAHAYVRYLGDLSGGQVLRRIVQRMFALPEGRGTALYEFPAVPDIEAAKAHYREALDGLPVTDGGDAIVAEAIQAFRWYEQLFVELASSHGAGSGA